MLYGLWALCTQVVLQDNCLNLLLAAHDMSAATLCMIMRYLKKEPETLRQLQAEQAQVCSAAHLHTRSVVL